MKDEKAAFHSSFIVITVQGRERLSEAAELTSIKYAVAYLHTAARVRLKKLYKFV